MTENENRSGVWLAVGVALIGALATIVAAVITGSGAGPDPGPTAPPVAAPPAPLATSALPASVTRGPSTSPSEAKVSPANGGGLVYLEELKPVESDNLSMYDGSATVNGVSYAHSVRTYHAKGSASFEYDLGRGYSRLQATVGLRDDDDADARRRVEVFGDGALLRSVDVALGKPQVLDVPLTGVLRLKIVQTTLNEDFAAANVIWGDAAVIR